MQQIAIGALWFLILFGCNLTSALACDPNEDCSRCLVDKPFNMGCEIRGNDPICEARKKACQISPPIVNTPGSPFGPGGPLASGGPVPGIGPAQVQHVWRT